ncbi:DUF6966 domain-containing protein [Desulfoluna spongiiphila]|uniref:DUF6966 domain-containing protein n=1 Tax=Desulfoluna spongiiphila TaxID=419481 RepID=UPI00111370DC|nr:hypothetical protein [Desulfoluna spongiiphila]
MKIQLSIRKNQLDKLIQSLEHLCIHLRLDEDCPWIDHFERQLENAKSLSNSKFTQKELSDLSSSIRSVYGGMGSFNDYYNPNYTKHRNEVMKLLGSSTDLSERVYEYALELMVIGITSS